jgi:hypothetical protein
VLEQTPEDLQSSYQTQTKSSHLTAPVPAASSLAPSEPCGSGALGREGEPDGDGHRDVELHGRPPAAGVSSLGVASGGGLGGRGLLTGAQRACA